MLEAVEWLTDFIFFKSQDRLVREEMLFETVSSHTPRWVEKLVNASYVKSL